MLNYSLHQTYSPTFNNEINPYKIFSSGQYAISGIKPHSNDRAIANTMGQSLYATTSTSLSRITNSNIQVSRLLCSTVPRDICLLIFMSIRTAKYIFIIPRFSLKQSIKQSSIKSEQKCFLVLIVILV